MSAINAWNARFGRGSAVPARSGLARHLRAWMTKFEMRTPRYNMDGFSAANPNSFHVFEGRPRSLLGKLREFDEKLAKAKGDARRGAGRDVTWIVNDYNTMVSTAQTATMFSR
ncbi:DUF4113 domain-containing protein [Methylorubrum aminovorans]